VKTLEWDDSNQINLQLWDVAGHERFGTMTRVYYKYAIAAVIVFDIQRPATFDAVLKWRDDVNQKVVLANDEPIPCILLANKCDQPNVRIDDAALDQFCLEHNFAAWFATSAASNQGIDEAMNFLVTKILDVARANRLPATENPDALNVSATAANARDAAGRKNPSKGNDCC
jgi:Ras-related protein Rab-32